jgi:hypothetical protein
MVYANSMHGEKKRCLPNFVGEIFYKETASEEDPSHGCLRSYQGTRPNTWKTGYDDDHFRPRHKLEHNLWGRRL